MSRVLVIANENSDTGSPAQLDDVLVNLARQNAFKLFGIGRQIANKWYFTITDVKMRKNLVFSEKDSISIEKLPDCFVIVHADDSQALRATLGKAGHKTEVVYHNF